MFVATVTDHRSRNGHSRLSSPLPLHVIKRDGRVEPYDPRKIVGAVERCLQTAQDLGETQNTVVANNIATAVTNILSMGETKILSQKGVDARVGVEELQRLVIQQLWALDYFDAAEHYTLYRERHRQQREQVEVDPADAAAVAEDAKHFPTPAQYFQFLDKYARWNEAKGRRETWRECVDRVMAFFREQPQLRAVDDETWRELDDGLFQLQALPAMRVLQMAGPALSRCNVGAFNCSYLAVDCIEVFREALYILMAGGGVGFSVESEYVDKLPRIRKQRAIVHGHIVADSTEGWCDALHFGLKSWFAGEDVTYDTSKVRPAGARLKTKGGRASGPGPLLDLLVFCRTRVLSRQGGRLSPRDVHDMMCVVGNIVHMGGVRRASLISLSDLDDVEMRTAKTGNWWESAEWLRMANNSAVYEEKPSAVTFMEEWLSLAKSGSGERGIFNRQGVNKQLPKRRKKAKFGTNPCFGAGTLIVTREGAYPVEDLVGKEVEVWDGDEWRKTTFHVTGRDQPTLRIEMQDGAVLRVTPYHGMLKADGTKLEAKDLKVCPT
jgi:ribonucleoside-triphosphate reductase